MSANDFYTTLGLAGRRLDTTLSPAEIKRAYHATLLRFHPDKSRSESVRPADSTTSAKRPGPSVDQITQAFRILGDPKARPAYDWELAQRLNNNAARTGGGGEAFFSGFDTADLDELDYDERQNVWRRPCRCGHEEGFVIREDDLEHSAAVGELMTGCRGCSLWLKVLFQVADEEGEEREGSRT